MKKIGILTDSSSGLSIKQCEDMGIHNLPMPFLVNEKEYYEEKNISKKEFFKVLNEGASFSTSQPSPDEVLNKWDELLKVYDEILYFPITSGLSSSYSTAMTLAEDDKYKNKIFVVDHKRITGCLVNCLKDAKAMIDSGKSCLEVRNIVEQDRCKSSYIIQLDTLDYLAKGGRMNNAAAFIGNILSVKPILASSGNKFELVSKTRTLSSGKQIILDLTKEFIDKELKCSDYNELVFYSVHIQNETLAKEFAEDIKSYFSLNKDVEIHELPLVVACHIGPGAIACAMCKPLS